jgi:hypothetical protein
MPIAYDIEDNLIVVRFHGPVTSQDFAGYLSATDRDPRYRTDLSRLVLMDHDAQFPASNEIIQYAARTPQRKLAPDVRFACVANTPLSKGIASMFMGNAGLGDNYQLFDEVTAARKWLEGRD